MFVGECLVLYGGRGCHHDAQIRHQAKSPRENKQHEQEEEIDSHAREGGH
jgi:hypothetical protein